MDSFPLLLPSFFFLFSYLFFFFILVAFRCVCCFFRPNQKLQPFTYPVLNLRRLVSTRYPSCSAVRLIPGANWVCRSGFFNAKSTLFYWSPPLARNSTVLPSSPASKRRPPLFVLTTTHQHVCPRIDQHTSSSMFRLLLLFVGCFVVFMLFFFLPSMYFYFSSVLQLFLFFVACLFYGLLSPCF